jgi:glycosyltransferase involved in cell wall biosynthesis
LLLFYKYAWHSIPLYKPHHPGEIRISVIVAARNEAINLPALLNSLSRQTYRNFELIIIDDFSTDATVDIIQNFAAGWLKLIRLSDHISGNRNTAINRRSYCNYRC